MDTLGYKVNTKKSFIDSFDITPCLRATDSKFDPLNWVCDPAVETTCCMFCDKMEGLLSDKDNKIVTNGIDIINDECQRLMAILKDDEEFNIGKNRDAASCRSGFS